MNWLHILFGSISFVGTAIILNNIKHQTIERSTTITLTIVGTSLVLLGLFGLFNTPSPITNITTTQFEGTVQFGKAIPEESVYSAQNFIRNSMKDGAGDLDAAYALDVIANRLYAKRTIGVWFDITGFMPYWKLDKYQQARCDAYLRQLETN